MPKRIIVACPHCGRPSTYTQRTENGSQVDLCRHCNKTFRMEFRSGELRDARA